MSAIRNVLMASVAIAALATPAFAQELDVIRIGLLGGENEADRLADNQCLIDKLPAALGVKEVQLFPAADYDGVIQGLLGGTLDIAGLGASAYAAVYLQDPARLTVRPATTRWPSRSRIRASPRLPTPRASASATPIRTRPRAT
jgi:phosphonate transport system substrate-binding protein